MLRAGYRTLLLVPFGLVTVGVVLSLGVGCRSSKSEAIGGSTSTPVATHSTTPGSMVTAAVPSASESSGDALNSEATEKDKVKAVLENWLRAQNTGNFADYEQLYAPRFTGVKRAGSRTQRFDREGWIADRKPMFDKPFSVTVSDEQVTTSGNMAIVELTQVWASTTFRDSGKKRLVLVRGQRWQIASEEMLDSRTGDRAAGAEPPAVDDFVFVRSDRQQRPVLVLSDEVDVNAVQGHPEYTSDERAERPVLTRALAPKWRELVGQRYALYDATGKVCEATINGFRVFIEVVPHFGLVGEWNAMHGGTPTPPAQRALELWQLSERGGRFLVATLEGCEHLANWARKAELPEPRIWTQRKPDTTELKRALAVARSTPVYRDYLKQLKSTLGKREVWDTGPVHPRVFEDGMGQSFVALMLHSEEEVCGTFGAQLLILLQKGGSDYRLVSPRPDQGASEHPPWFFPDLGFDLDGDGRPEFLGGDEFLRETDAGYRSVLDISPAFFDCPC